LYIAADEGEIKMSTKQTKNGKIWFFKSL